MNELVARVRGVVRYVRQSPIRLARFKKCFVIEKIQSKFVVFGCQHKMEFNIFDVRCNPKV